MTHDQSFMPDCTSSSLFQDWVSILVSLVQKLKQLSFVFIPAPLFNIIKPIPIPLCHPHAVWWLSLSWSDWVLYVLFKWFSCSTVWAAHLKNCFHCVKCNYIIIMQCYQYFPCLVIISQCSNDTVICKSPIVVIYCRELFVTSEMFSCCIALPVIFVLFILCWFWSLKFLKNKDRGLYFFHKYFASLSFHILFVCGRNTCYWVVLSCCNILIYSQSKD